MKVERYATLLGYSLAGVLVLMGAGPSRALAQSHDSHVMTSPQTAGQKSRENKLISVVRDATEDLQTVGAAKKAGYDLLFGCVSGGDYGAMGLHYVNFPLVMDGKIDATKPEIVLFEPMPNGRPRITGADFLVLAEAWHADPTHTLAPELHGQYFHYFEAPNRFGLPPFYTLHVWAYKDNPLGAFTNWHPNVSCEDFNPQQ